MRRDAILRQLGYTITPNAVEQVGRVINNTKNYDYVEKHLIALNDSLKPRLSFIAISSTHDYFKIKNEAKGKEMINGVSEIIQNWSRKYKIELEKVPDKETYYILGKSA